MYKSSTKLSSIVVSFVALVLFSAGVFASPTPLFEKLNSAPVNKLPEHVLNQHEVRVNRQILQSSEIAIALPEHQDSIIAVRSYIERRKAGTHIWVGHVQGDMAATVIITFKGMQVSGLIQWQGKTYRLNTNQAGKQLLYEVDIASLPSEEPDGILPLGDSAALEGASPQTDSVVADNVIQDLLVVYTQGACNYAGSCAQLEADIDTAIADLNNAYALSGINITMNLVGTHLTNYTGTNASETLGALRSTTDGNMDEVHQVRDNLGADIVSLIYDGQGCGIGYLGSNASSAFNVTDVPCMVGNRTLAHEIGHNQGAHHDRQTVGGGVAGAYNYGFRRCNDGSVDDIGTPYFRTIMAYGCASASRVGRFSNPTLTYSGVQQGVDPAAATVGAWNARTLNESATYVASFRATQSTTPPQAPTNLDATEISFNSVSLTWQDNANDENGFVLQRRTSGGAWQTIASLAQNTQSFTDTGLVEQTTYEYRIAADNNAGFSDYSNTVLATTLTQPDSITEYAEGEIFGTGQITNTYMATLGSDGVTQVISESSSGGPKRSRRQSFVHTWLFNVAGGAGGVTFKANAWVSDSEGANFSYSVDGGSSWQALFTVSSQSTDNVEVALLTDVSGDVWVRATDAEQSNGEAVDSLYVDNLEMVSSTSVPVAPASPSSLSLISASASTVSLEFMDNADNESGFSLYRATTILAENCTGGSEVATVSSKDGTGLVTAEDVAAQANTTYYYWVRAFNAGGESDFCTNTVTVTTEQAQAELSARGYKQKGIQNVELTWSGVTGDSVDIYRDGQWLRATSNDLQEVDNTGNKGGGTYRYQVCQQGSQAACTNTATVSF
ncbi:reprolysin-like metallopeptidase [Alteromonas sediminis]|nr:zinc-dependent metalloprotease family protein [Alteromonas sediminis]